MSDEPPASAPEQRKRYVGVQRQSLSEIRPAQCLSRVRLVSVARQTSPLRNVYELMEKYFSDIIAISVRFFAFNFDIMCLTCTLTVFSVIPK